MADANGYGCYEEYEEEEVWDAVKDGSPRSRRAKKAFHASSSTSSECPPSGSRISTPRASNIAVSPGASGRALKKSASVTIPNRSIVHRDVCSHGGDGNDEEEEEEEEEDSVPPHEWLAKKMARSQISSSSVCEGAGRTLKGRDLREVRNAVLAKTGFLQ